jgi:hypothetical protein
VRGSHKGTGGGKTMKTSRAKVTEIGVIRRIHEVRRLPERRGKGSEDRRREIRWGGVKVGMWE